MPAAKPSAKPSKRAVASAAQVVAGRRSVRNGEWIERHLCVPEGKLVGQPVKLTDEEWLWLEDIYDNPAGTRTFILSMARKNAKTAFSSMLLLLHLAGPEAKRNSQLNSGAQTKEQAALLFKYAAKMVRMSPALKAHVVVRDTVKELLCPGMGSLYKALAAEGKNALGLSPAFNVHDELGAEVGPTSALYEAMETAMGAQESPLTVIISTQAATDSALLSTLIDDALTGRDPTVKVRLYTADLELDPFGDEAIRQANPHFDVFMNQAEVRKAAQDAKALPSRESSYRNLILNQRVEARSALFSRGLWEQNGAEPGPIEQRSKVWLGLDLSAVSDLTALIGMTPRDGGWDVHSTFWLPEKGLAEKARLDKVPYDVWRDKGFLHTTPGATVEYEFVAAHLRGLFDRCDVQAVAFDRYNMRFLTPWLRAEGFSEAELEKFQEFGQGFVSMSPAIRALESLVRSQKLRHGNHPVLAMCCSNAVVATDPAENRKFVKDSRNRRIDGMVALAMAAGVTPTTAVEAPKPRLRWA